MAIEELKIDPERFEEISHSFMEKLGGEKVFKMYIFNQDGEVVFPAGQPAGKEDVAPCPPGSPSWTPTSAAPTSISPFPLLQVSLPAR